MVQSYFKVCREETALVRNFLFPCSLYLDDEFLVTKKLGGTELSFQLSWEHQRIRTVGILAESLTIQLPNRFHLREACIPQHTLDLIETGSKGEEEREQQISGSPRGGIRGQGER